jgi:hypothetical protein
MIRAISDDGSTAHTAALTLQCDAGVRMGMPEAGWSREELSGRACWENEQIGRSRRCAPQYWYLGKILRLVQDQVQDGHWESWCEEHTIQRNRWQRGRLLAMAFDSPDDVADLTVHAAEALAREALGLPPRQTAADTKLRRWLRSLEKSSQQRLDESSQVARPDGLRPRIAELIRQLTALDHALVALEKRTASRAAKPRRDKRPK